MQHQALDNMDLERERGITIKSHAIQIDYQHTDGQTYTFNLIDTPGHVDFSYEVSRSIAACEGALLLVDASQGIQAQTISNLYLAIDHDLEIIPILNKVDMISAMIEEVSDQIIDLIGCSRDEIILASGKTGQGVEDILAAAVDRIPAPSGDSARSKWLRPARRCNVQYVATAIRLQQWRRRAKELAPDPKTAARHVPRPAAGPSF